MIKKVWLIAILIPICLGLGHSATADEPQFSMVGAESLLKSALKPHFGRDFSASVGVKTWFNQWDSPNYSPQTKKGEPESVVSYLSDSKFTSIPVLSLRYKNFFVSGSYFSKTDYNFGSQLIEKPLYISPTKGKGGRFDGDTAFFYEGETVSGVVTVKPEVQLKIPVKVSPEANRSEWDINMGYFIHPSLAVSIGYKKVKRHFKSVIQVPDVSYRLYNPDTEKFGEPTLLFKGPETITDDKETKGFTLGIASVVPLQGRFGLYGNFAFGWLETTSNIGSYDSNYYLGEMGFLYSHKLESITALHAASIHLGYRFQAIDDNLPVKNSEIRGAVDSTEGFVLGVNLSF